MTGRSRTSEPDPVVHANGALDNGPASAAGTRRRILVPGRNCWRIEGAARVALLVDGDAYFRAFREAVKRARRSIFVVGWDVDSRTDLLPAGDRDEWPRALGDFLDAVVKARRRLHAYVLDWDFAMLYALDREVLPIYKFDWRTHRRLHFHLDAEHPVGASHHQKIVVIDDKLAFVGGLDLTKRRWDTPEHRPQDALRRDPDGERYAPFHDAQLMVDGDAAAALGELVRTRWERATGRRPHADVDGGDDPWPPKVVPDMENVEVAIARTEPRHAGREEVAEEKALYLDAIAAAQRFVYLENQYFTSAAVGDAIAKRLAEPDGPEIVIVSRLRGSGWLERQTMEVLRARLLERLRAHDPHGRLRTYFPHQEGLDEPLSLHTKLMVVDDRLLRVGSANLSNRSMGLDTECDLAIEGYAPEARKAIGAMRNRLLGEHLGVEPTRVADELAARRSLIAVVDALGGRPRTLRPLATHLSSDVDRLLPEAEVIDPERPVDPDALADAIVPREGRRRAAGRIAVWTIVVLGVAGLAAAWRYTALSEWLDPRTLAGGARFVRESPAAPLWVLGAYLGAALVAFPITILIVATALVFGPLWALLYALVGALSAAALTFWIGHTLGRNVVRRVAGSRINRLSRQLGRRGLLAVAAVRIVPVAPFTVVNLVAGASHIRFGVFMLGTLLGMTPGIAAVTVFSDRVNAVVRDPSPQAIAILALVTAAIAVLALAVRGWLARRGMGERTSAAQSNSGETQ